MSNDQRKTVESITARYQPRERNELDELLALDRRVRRPAEILAYVLGTISALILGFGMCIAMGVILPDLFVVGIAVGILGIALVTLNYFLYRAHLGARKRRYADEVLSLSTRILGSEH